MTLFTKIELTYEPEQIRSLKLERQFRARPPRYLRRDLAQEAPLRRAQNIGGCYFQPSLTVVKISWRRGLQNRACFLLSRPETPNLRGKFFIVGVSRRASQQDEN